MTSLPTTRIAFKAAEIGRGLEGFRNRGSMDLQPSGVAELDAILGGGFPRGSLVELYGPISSGRTSLALSVLAQATERQEACAFVDVSDSLDPFSLAAAGVDLPRLLWIRCGETRESGPVSKDCSLFVDSEDKTKRNLNPVEGGEKTMKGHFWRHPRNQIRGIETAIPSLMRNKPAGSSLPAESARIHVIARCAGEQVERDRELPRREIRRPHFLLNPEERPAAPKQNRQPITKPWKRLEQALKATDTLLHSGGWGVVVFDLGGISWLDARRINLSMWFRFRRAIENTPTILLLLGEESCAKSCASLVLRCQRRGESWNRAVPNALSGISTFEGFEVEGEVVRSRTQSQPADSARWQTRTLWTDRF
jgi:recombination protein RecA